MKSVDIAWLAGLVEGEGCIGFYKNGQHSSGHEYHLPKLTINMTDKDVIQKAADLFGSKVNGPYNPGKNASGESYKQKFAVNVYGSRAIGWMMTLYPFLGSRRRAKAREVVQLWRENTNLRGDRQSCRVPPK